MGRVADVVRLVRAPLAPTAAADTVACALLARGPGFSSGSGPAPEALSWPGAAGLVATALLVYAAGMAGNDLVDRGRDRTIHPERPLPAGRLSSSTAAAIVGLAAGIAIVVAGGPQGHLLPVVGALFLGAAYNVSHRRFPLGSAALMGATRFANAATGVWPLVLSGAVSPLAFGGPLAIGLYSLAITVLSTAEETEAAARRAVLAKAFAEGAVGDATPRDAPRRLAARGLTFVAFAAAGLLSMFGAEGVTFGALVLAPAACLTAAFGTRPKRGPVPRQVLEMLLGLYWLDALLATAGWRGSEWAPTLVALAVGYALILLSQVAVLALRPRPA